MCYVHKEWLGHQHNESAERRESHHDKYGSSVDEAGHYMSHMDSEG